MRFSIIVPIYNVEKYLKKCIKSIINQTYDNFELILVDDGSSDSCPAICDYYSHLDSRLVVIHKNNGGLVSARQAGINIAKGDYSIYVDGDDWIATNTLLEINRIIEAFDVDLVCYGFYNVNSNACIKSEMCVPKGKYDKKRIIQNIYPFLIENAKSKYFNHSACGKAFKTSILKKYQNLVSKDIVMSEDAAVTIPLLLSISSLYVSRKCFYYYNQLNNNSITKKKKPLNWDGPSLLEKHFISFQELNVPYFKQQIYRNTVHNLFNVAVSQFNSGESYAYNRSEILKRISSSQYSESIDSCSFNTLSKGKLAEIALRHKLVLLICLYWRIK